MTDIIDSAPEIGELQRNTAIKIHRLNYQATSTIHRCECDNPIDEREHPVVQSYRTYVGYQGDLKLISKQRGPK